MPSFAPPISSELPMLLRASPRKAYAICGERLGRVLAHGQHVGQDLGRVELVGQAVPDRHAGVVGQRLDDLLVEAAVLDAVVEPAEHARGVLDRSPCGPSATTAGRGRSRARPGRRRRPRTSSACASRSSRRSGRSPSGELLGLVPAVLGGLEARRPGRSGRGSRRGEKSSSLRKLRPLRGWACVVGGQSVIGSAPLLRSGSRDAAGRSCSGRRRGPCRSPIRRWSGPRCRALRMQRVGVLVALVGDDDAGLEGDDVVAVIPLLALGLPLVAAGLDDSQLLDARARP